MIDNILPGLYRLEIPIPNSPLKATNAYVISGTERNLLVDTGLNCPESLAAIQLCLEELAIDMKKTDIFLTHLHSDHSGLVSALKTETSKLYASTLDAEVINRFLTEAAPWEKLYSAACRNGFSQEEAIKAIKRHPGNASSPMTSLDFIFVSEGTTLAVGDYCFTCIETPGHTDGHICLYESRKKILLSGDHIIGDISPNITNYLGDGNPLKDFLSSLQNIATLSVDLVLPGHRRVFNDCQGRISELLEHHRLRIDEAYRILSNGPLTGYQVASRMTWDMVFSTWDDVAVPQKFFATGEALSHLRYLECEGLIKQRIVDNYIYYER